jgi:hypothetical protein
VTGRLLILIAVVGAGSAMGWAGRLWRGRRRPPPSTSLGAGVWLFTAPYCPPCGHVRTLLEPTPDVHEVSVVDRPDLVRELDIRSAPTLVAVDHAGALLATIVGVPKEGELQQFLRAAGR